MMNTEDLQDSAHEQPETGHVGQQLRRAREAHGLSITQVADSQHLRPAVIQSIEDGNYEKIGSELFLRGYVKAYAEQVQLAAAPLLQQLNKELEPLRQKAVAEEQDNPLEKIERKKKLKRRIARWVIGILAVVVIGYFAFQMFAKEIVSVDNSDAQSQETMSESENAAAALPSDEKTSEPTDENNTAAGQSSGTGSSAPGDSAPAENIALPLTGTGSSNAQVSAGADASQDEGGVSAPAGDDQVISDLSASQQFSAADDEDTQVADQPGDALRVEFSGNCWVSLENGDGKKVVASLKRGGETLRYRGEGPFKVVLGAADTASVWFNGDMVDLSQYPASNNRVALTLGQ